MKQFLSIIFFLSTTSLFSQETGTIYGIIKDSETGNKMLGADVLIVKTSIGTSTNSKGFYELNITEGTYLLSISYIGYHSCVKKITIQKGQKKN